MKRKEEIKFLKIQLDLICEKQGLFSKEVIDLSQKLDLLIAIEQRENLNKLLLKV
ncbi:spo0E like sporulation regulatory family protein [[Clostridium] sordellii ATCC 9714]|uniref:Sporulation stage 0, spo0e-like regulatory phosphatase n=1 Tax=Paraclostridium sordellii TaxID=1505 RepID=A0ABM9RTW8_PARSO|nr:aspartyl-phosphate phosphatase Spo0E family protein [Paeniclostridium sordellii]EPZ62102.1 spo0E like sporulation regulatory family protein [[Clostridium] sordellii ATCC 9714] [Paeniclostridium sordellii ATCC 9714]TAN66149.1 aspartyl-phosphate phosphatase Spo0E family protein [Paeniclostridium sordellii 8483]CEJ75517.1 sporulation stage 0, spo0e-like regulatory phosphatase (plasmid) [[Clostridium] sordellii] [Paeniclostridium sordellii]CEN22475.1 Spo0E like sporulation regulatory protein [[C